MVARRALPLLSAALVVPLLVHAAELTKTAQFQVSVTIVGECNAITPLPVNFGANVGAGYTQPINAEAQISVLCTANTPYSIALNGGQNGTPVDRKMKSAADELPYGLYSDPARTAFWGDGASGARVSGTGNGMTQAITVYGKLPVPSAVPKPGTYTDTVTATLTY